jgi:DNA (cytosine-5)-methyltransferase 1
VIHVGSLFSGIGGIELGLERTGGFRTVWFVEKDPYCQAVLGKHWPRIPIYGDIKQLDFNRVERPDMLTGGFPCQPTSTAGKRRGRKDMRWLWPEFARAIRVLQPGLVMVENPPGLLSKTEEFAEVLADLASCGFDAEWNHVWAASVGAPHLRERIFLLAYTNGGNSQPHTNSIQETDEILRRQAQSDRSSRCGKVLAHSDKFRFYSNLENILSRQRKSNTTGSGWWATEPHLDRMASRIPNQLDRLASLGNAVVPACAQAVGEMILEWLVQTQEQD